MVADISILIWKWMALDEFLNSRHIELGQRVELFGIPAHLDGRAWTLTSRTVSAGEAPLVTASFVTPTAYSGLIKGNRGESPVPFMLGTSYSQPQHLQTVQAMASRIEEAIKTGTLLTFHGVVYFSLPPGPDSVRPVRHLKLYELPRYALSIPAPWNPD